MDLKMYFHKMRTIEAAIAGDHVVVVSVETPDGGRPDQMSEVSRETAAKLVVQGKARIATDEESERFRTAVRDAKKAADQESLKDRIQLSVLHPADLELLKSALRKEK